MHSEPSHKSSYSTQNFWDLLNQEEPGLRRMAKAMHAGDDFEAESAYLAYQRERDAPVLSWIHSSVEHSEKRRSAFDFFKEIPEHLTWHDKRHGKELISLEKGTTSHRLEGIKPSPFSVVELAELLLDNKVMLVYHPEDGVQDLGPHWNWEHVPPEGGQGRRWTLSLPYQYFLFALAQAYWATDDDRYIAKLVWIYSHYIDYVDNRSDWIWLPDMQLARCYLQLMPFILSWKDLPSRDYCRLRHWLATTCAQSMEGVESAPGNQIFFNGLGILWLGVGMPEFARSAHWRERGWENISSYFGEGAFYPDGTSKENSFGYIIGSSESAIEAVNLATNNCWPYPDSVAQAMVKRAEFLADLIKPDGTCPWIGDSQRRSPISYVEHMVRVIEREDLEYEISFGNRGAIPEHTSCWYSWQGLSVMRNGWGVDANYLMFDVGPLGMVHAHEGKLAIEVVAYGRSLIEDLGVHSYSREAPELPYYNLFGNTRGHNTVTVDGLSQMRLVTGPETVDKPLTNPWTTNELFDYLSGDYDNGWGPGQYVEPMASVFESDSYDGLIDTSVVHHRSVIYVKGLVRGDCEYWIVTDYLSGSGEHTYEQLFHFIPTSLEVDQHTKMVKTRTDGEANIVLLPAHPDSVELQIVEGRTKPDMQGWYCGAGPNPVPAPCVVYRQTGVPPRCFQTVLWPQRPNESYIPKITSMGMGSSSWLRVCRPDGGEDVYFSASHKGTYEFGELSFDGAAVLVRFDMDGKPTQWSVVGGDEVRWQGKGLVNV